jgi:hypothetical protein
MSERCQFCGGDFRLNVVANRQTKVKYLRAGCCDSPLRTCPNPDELLLAPSLTLEERSYLQRLQNLDWFSGQVAAVLLQIEAKVKANGGVAA